MLNDKLKNFLFLTFSQTSLCAQGNRTGDLRSALTIVRPAKVSEGTERKLIMLLSTLIATFLIMNLAHAGQLDPATPGIYYPGSKPCENVSGAGQLLYDGQNVQGEKGVCRTEMLANHKFRQTCSEGGAGKPQPKLADIDSDPLKSIFEINIEAKSSTTIQFNNVQYTLCEAMK